MNDIKVLADTLKSIHTELLRHAANAVNLSLTIRNWLYGYFIQEYELKGSERSAYGTKTIENLADLLQSADIPATSHRHLKTCRQFYTHYPNIGPTVSALFQKMTVADTNLSIRPTLSAQSHDTALPSFPPERLLQSLSFSHFVELLKIEEPLKRCFYEMECIRGVWSVRELRRQIGSLYYERSGLSKNKQKLSRLVHEAAQQYQPTDLIRDPYIFEFLKIKPHEVILESKLADALLDKLQHFLLELGKGFCFEARNKRILIGDEYFFIDLVFYHRVLKCSILCELKTSAFDHSHIGQLNTYLNYFKKHEMNAGDNPPLGILLCTEKNHALVEYALSDTSNPLFVSQYKLELPSEALMQTFIEKQLKEELVELSHQQSLDTHNQEDN